jgi:beta-xylosidase
VKSTASILACVLVLAVSGMNAQTQLSKVWVADNGDGTYKNPVLRADYSDPDVIRVKDDFYLVASSFDAVPGLPILQSKDLVNWTIIAHALNRVPPYDVFSHTQHGNGLWAPSIRFHDNEFWIYYSDPDRGIFLTRSKEITGPWSEPEIVESGKGLIDPCPLWDDDGKAYLVHAFAGSRAGIKSILVVKQMNMEGTKVVSGPVIVYDGHDVDPTVEGPKFYKRHGYYYIFAPAGGVTNGWQVVLRSKNVYGPYERRVVMDQGSTATNGPHQGAWVTTQSGEDWFIHFQDRGVYGRVVHLQPLVWKGDWPVIGADNDGDGKGEPVASYKKPDVGGTYPRTTPQESDEFNTSVLGLQWQWQANPSPEWVFTTREGFLRMNAVKIPDSARNYWDVPAVLLQKFPAEEFVAVAKASFHSHSIGDRFGLIIMGASYAYVSLIKKVDGIYATYDVCNDASLGRVETEQVLTKIDEKHVYLNVEVKKGGVCSFGYSNDGAMYVPVAERFQAVQGTWIGAKVGLFCSSNTTTNDAGFAEVDWFGVEEPR